MSAQSMSLLDSAYFVLTSRPLSCLSVVVCWISLLAIVIRLMPNKNARKAYHVVIMVQSVFDLLDSTSRPVCVLQCTNYYIIMVPRLLRVLSWLLTAITAIFWLKIFLHTTGLLISLSALLLLASLPIIIAYLYFLFAKENLDSISIQENIILAWIKAVSFLLCAIVVLICLVRVLRTDVSSFATLTTYKGYRKVASGLGLKCLSILAVAATSAQDALRQTTTTEDIPSWMYFFIDTYPGVNACITMWMLSRLIWKTKDKTVVQRISSNSNKNGTYGIFLVFCLVDLHIFFIYPKIFNPILLAS